MREFFPPARSCPPHPRWEKNPKKFSRFFMCLSIRLLAPHQVFRAKRIFYVNALLVFAYKHGLKKLNTENVPALMVSSRFIDDASHCLPLGQWKIAISLSSWHYKEAQRNLTLHSALFLWSMPTIRRPGMPRSACISEEISILKIIKSWTETGKRCLGENWQREKSVHLTPPWHSISHEIKNSVCGLTREKDGKNGKVF